MVYPLFCVLGSQETLCDFKGIGVLRGYFCTSGTRCVNLCDYFWGGVGRGTSSARPLTKTIFYLNFNMNDELCVVALMAETTQNDAIKSINTSQDVAHAPFVAKLDGDSTEKLF